MGIDWIYMCRWSPGCNRKNNSIRCCGQREGVAYIFTTHCVLHRKALASKTLPKKLKEVMGIVVQTVNFISGHAFDHRLFQKFCNSIGADHNVLL